MKKDIKSQRFRYPFFIDIKTFFKLCNAFRYIKSHIKKGLQKVRNVAKTYSFFTRIERWVNDTVNQPNLALIKLIKPIPL